MPIPYFFALCLVFLIGAAIASFLCNVVYRLLHQEKFLKNRSKCEHCQHFLEPWDLIPVLSFAWLRGRCRYCRQPIPAKYWLTEIITGVIFVISFVTVFPSIAADFNNPELYFKLLFEWWSIGILLFVALYDIEAMMVIEAVVWIAILVTAIFRMLLLSWQPLGPSLAAFASMAGVAILNALFIWTIVLISKEQGMGKGDIGLAFLIGLIAGWPGAVASLLLAFVSGATVGLMLIALRTKTLRQVIPFAPFLAFGGITAMLFGEAIIRWYSQTFLLF